MRSSIFTRMVLYGILLAVIFGCGGGGGSGGGGGGGVTQATVVSGVAQAGVIANGTVKVYGILADGALTLLTTAIADQNGNYNANIGSYRGAVLVKAFGSYLDEATNKTIVIPEDKAIQAALPANEVAGNVSIPVTPLTDIAVRDALAAGGIAVNIAGANDAVSQLFGVNIKTLPAAPTAAALQSPGTTSDQKNYTAVLAVLSQYVADTSLNTTTPTADDLQNALAEIGKSITTAGTNSQIASPQVAMTLQLAAAESTTNVNTQSLIVAAGATAQNSVQNLTTVGNTAGTKIVGFKVRTSGSYTGQFYGIQARFSLPSGVTVRGDATTGETTPGVIVVSGVAPTTSMIVAKTSSNTLSIDLANSAGIGLGEYATIYCDIPVNSPVPAASAFVPSNVKLVDADGTAIGGVAVEVFQ